MTNITPEKQNDFKPSAVDDLAIAIGDILSDCLTETSGREVTEEERSVLTGHAKDGTATYVKQLKAIPK